ncbi:hypothetical protein [Natronococcus occultus]|uniref:Uncharacterized protein n=1 Tax=Natronococcus occultus SP4 TaxID=694430 RepID=L0JV47_9EURY|nr:hypothetical protein [Natronococcus occultus]AGB36646.1 hypothetical protein Natoc_0789 [Natronococcus occultus SP4]
MSHERRQPVASAGRPDLGFQAAFGFYFGVVAGGLVALVGLAADVTTATLLGTIPTVVTAVTLVGHVLAKRSCGLPERIGRRRRLRLACYLPAVAFAAAAAAASVTLVEPTSRSLALLIGFALVLGVTAFGLASLCRNRFVRAVTTDEPTATWAYRPAGLLHAGGVLVALSLAFVFVAGIVSVAAGSVRGLFWIAFGAVMVIWTWAVGEGDDSGKKYYGNRFSLDVDQQTQQGTLRAHERGVRHDVGRSKKLIPWEKIEDVRLTEDELVLERRVRNLRCDREAIDDPESVYETLEELHSRAENRGRTADRR